MRYIEELNVWQCANKRFHQTVASEYLISNKALYCVAFIAVLVFFLNDGTVSKLGMVISLVSLLIATSRRAKYLGFYDGYEQGHEDATNNPNNLHTFHDAETELYWKEKEAVGIKKNALFSFNRMQ